MAKKRPALVGLDGAVLSKPKGKGKAADENAGRREISGWCPPIKVQADLPKPFFWQLLVQPMAITYSGKIELPESVKTKAEFLRTVVRVLAIGPLAFKDPTKYGPNAQAPCKVGDWVLVDVYVGQKYIVNDQEVRMVTEDDIRGAAPNPAAFRFYI